MTDKGTSKLIERDWHKVIRARYERPWDPSSTGAQRKRIARAVALVENWTSTLCKLRHTSFTAGDLPGDPKKVRRDLGELVRFGVLAIGRRRRGHYTVSRSFCR